MSRETFADWFLHPLNPATGKMERIHPSQITAERIDVSRLSTVRVSGGPMTPNEALANYREQHQRLMEELEAKRTERMKALRKISDRHRWSRRFGKALGYGVALTLAMLVSAAVAGAFGLMLLAWRWLVGLV